MRYWRSFFKKGSVTIFSLTKKAGSKVQSRRDCGHKASTIKQLKEKRLTYESQSNIESLVEANEQKRKWNNGTISPSHRKKFLITIRILNAYSLQKW